MTKTSRAPRSRFYDGAVYARVIDPMLGGLHAVVAKQIEAGARVLEAGCGTGDLAFRLAPHVSEVVGVELSPAMVEFANNRRDERGATNVSFMLGDVTCALASEPDAAFDVAVVVLVVHEMPHEVRGPVLAELARLAKRVLCVDFRTPMPWNLAGIRNRLIEVTAGGEHFGAFRDYSRRGGIPAVADEAHLRAELVRHLDAGTLSMFELSRNPSV